MRRFIFLLLLVALAGLGGALPTPTDAAERCIRMVQDRSGKYLINTCTKCRTVKVSHRRPGGMPPISRTFPLPAKGKMALPFKGPGTTRLKSETACRETSRQDGGAAGAAAGKRCVQLARRRDGGVSLYNGCAACRVVVAERTARNGAKSLETYGVSGGATLPMPDTGAPAVKIISDKPCP